MAFKKCKYCGGKNIRFYKSDIFGGRKPTYTVMCGDCHNETGEYASKDAAFNAWNKKNFKEVK